MIKFKWIVVCCLCSVFSIVFAELQNTAAVVVTHKYTVNPFQQLTIDGHIEIVLLPSKRAKYTMYVQRYSDQDFLVKQAGKKLQISQSDHFGFSDAAGPVVIKLQVPLLHEIDVKGDVVLFGRDLKAKNMTLKVDNSGVVYLRGHMNISKIIQNGDGEVNIRWLDSPSLIASIAGSSHLLLSGHVDDLSIHATNDCLLDAVNLKAKKVTVQANANAKIKVQPLYSLRANAAGNSKIGYYKHIRRLKISEQGSATVTQQAW
jgi:hypothetical protein